MAICLACPEDLHLQGREQWETNTGSPSGARSQKVVLVLSDLDGSETKIFESVNELDGMGWASKIECGVLKPFKLYYQQLFISQVLVSLQALL